MDGVQGGFFLRKKPLGLALPVYRNSETVRRLQGAWLMGRAEAMLTDLTDAR